MRTRSTLSLVVLPLVSALHCAVPDLGGSEGFESDGGSTSVTIDASVRVPRAVDPAPVFDESRHADNALPLRGGTLAVDAKYAVASDPDRARVSIAEWKTGTVRHVPLPRNADPGRVVLDDRGNAHVALRGLGEVLSIDLSGKTAPVRAPVCIAPRGIAYDRARSSLIIACAEGKLARISLLGERLVQLSNLVEDARDVVVTPAGDLLVSHFRSALIGRVGQDGIEHLDVPEKDDGHHLAWRMVIGRDGASVVTDQIETDPAPKAIVGYYGTPPEPSTGSYGGGATSTRCARSVVTTRLRVEGRGGILLPRAVLPVDVAVDERGERFAIAAAGNSHTGLLPQIFHATASDLPVGVGPKVTAGNEPCPEDIQAVRVRGEPVAVAFSGEVLFVQSREPALIHVLNSKLDNLRSIDLEGESVEDLGHSVFHSNSGGRIACASCHAEGGDDGRVWRLPRPTGTRSIRRTPSLLGTLKGTAPYHWSGEESGLPALMVDVFQGNMQGPMLSPTATGGVTSWLEQLAAPRPQETPNLSPRGRELFETRCATCHSGSHLTNNLTMTVATGEALQVPSLVGVAWRAPYMHDGCAKTLADRFSPACGGATHGDLSGLSKEDFVAIERHLRTL